MQYFESKNVRVFPASYRGDYQIIKNTEEVGLTFDPESRLNTEFNFTHIPGLGTGHTSYIISYDNTNQILKCVIGGYYFEIYNIDYTEFIDKIICVKTKEELIQQEQYDPYDPTNSIERDRPTYILMSWEANYNILDYKNSNDGKYYFTGIAIFDKDEISGESLAIGDQLILTVKDSNNNAIINYEAFIPVIHQGSVNPSLRTSTLNKADGLYSLASGEYTRAAGEASHAEGLGVENAADPTKTRYTQALGDATHAEGYFTTASGLYAHSEGKGTLATGDGAHAEGTFTEAHGNYSHAEGVAEDQSSFANPELLGAQGTGSHTEGFNTLANADYAHAEGRLTKAIGTNSHTEGLSTLASNNNAHAEGDSTKAIGISSHAEGIKTTASGEAAHATGKGLYLETQLTRFKINGVLVDNNGTLYTAAADVVNGGLWPLDDIEVGYFVTGKAGGRYSFGPTKIVDIKYFINKTEEIENWDGTIESWEAADKPVYKVIKLETAPEHWDSQELLTDVVIYSSASGVASTTMGNNTVAIADNATALGSNTIAKQENQTVIGAHNKQVDGELVIGIGSAAGKDAAKVNSLVANGQIITINNELQIINEPIKTKLVDVNNNDGELTAEELNGIDARNLPNLFVLKTNRPATQLTTREIRYIDSNNTEKTVKPDTPAHIAEIETVLADRQNLINTRKLKKVVDNIVETDVLDVKQEASSLTTDTATLTSSNITLKYGKWWIQDIVDGYSSIEETYRQENPKAVEIIYDDDNGQQIINRAKDISGIANKIVLKTINAPVDSKSEYNAASNNSNVESKVELTTADITLDSKKVNITGKAQGIVSKAGSGTNETELYLYPLSNSAGILKLDQNNANILNIKKVNNKWTTTLTNGYLELIDVKATDIHATNNIDSPYANVTSILTLGASKTSNTNSALVKFNGDNVIQLDTTSKTFGSTGLTAIISNNNKVRLGATNDNVEIYSKGYKWTFDKSNTFICGDGQGLINGVVDVKLSKNEKAWLSVFEATLDSNSTGGVITAGLGSEVAPGVGAKPNGAFSFNINGRLPVKFVRQCESKEFTFDVLDANGTTSLYNLIAQHGISVNKTAGVDQDGAIELKADGQIISTNRITANSFYTTSDKRLKENISLYKPEKSILDLPIYKYDFINGAKNQIGILAQDLQEICPELVQENEKGFLSIQESKLIYLLIDEVKKLKAEVKELKNVRK